MYRFAPSTRRTVSATTPRAARRTGQAARSRPAAAVPLRLRFSTLELLENRTLLSTYQVTNLNDSGAGSLRWAITQANDQTASPGLDTITFASNLSGSIDLATSLPAITDALTIQGSTDGHGVPLVTINGAGVDPSDFGNGLEVDADGSTISGLSVINFVNTAGIAVYA